MLAIGLADVNVANPGPELLLYPPFVAVGIVVISFLTTSMTAATGVRLPPRAATVRQVQQVMSFAWMGSKFGIGYGARLLAPAPSSPKGNPPRLDGPFPAGA